MKKIPKEYEPLCLTETLKETRKRCKNMTKVELTEEVNRTIEIAKKFFESGQATLEVAKGLQAYKHCYEGMQKEARCAALVLRTIADDDPPASFLIHMAEYISLIGRT